MKTIHLIGALCLFGLFACSAKRKSRIAAPSAELDIPFQVHQFKADSGTTLRLPTGTQIEIAPGSLVDSKGNVFHGQVEFRVREFHHPDDLFRAGIPMNTGVNGTEQLQTAGMIEMRAFAGKEELAVAAGQTIGVGLAGYRNSTKYDLWYLEEDVDWNQRRSFSVDSNRIKIQTVRSLSDSLNQQGPVGKEDDRTFELVSNIKEVPYLKAYAGVNWRLAADEPTESVTIQNRIHWGGVRIRRIQKKSNLYELTFIQFDNDDPAATKGIQKTIRAHALTNRTDMRKRTEEYEKEIAEFERLQNQRREELARAKREADLIQSFRADRLGIWNVDKLMKMEECTPVYVHFDFEKNLPTKDTKIRLFALYDGENSIAEFPREKWDQVYLQKGKPMRLIALLPNDQLALVDNNSIQQPLEKGLKEITFQTKQITQKAFLKTEP